MKTSLLALVFCLAWAAPVRAASVLFDVPGATVADANGWASTLYVNGTAFPLTHTCVLVNTVVTCTAALPAISTALAPGLVQTFEVDLFDAVLQLRSAKSVPFLRNRPTVPTSGRFQ